MNERIKLLVEQAGYTKGHHDEYGRLTVMAEFNKEKFAELIVQECIAQCEKNVDHEYLGWGSKLSLFNIKQHFGVKE